MKITKDTSIEDLVREHPASVSYLMKKGIRCLICGEAMWGTLEEAAKEKGFDEKEIEEIVKELKNLIP
ncbi:MAG: DUF1858 domain-containing protein [Ignavibacteria bacterium]|nr:DUF1858 domain-containing protein [Ignavibacteria bacterium]